MSDFHETSDGEVGRFWELRLGLYGSPGQLGDLVDRIGILLCPDPDHPPPCPIPWSESHRPIDNREATRAYPSLVEQVRIEYGPR